LNEPEKTMNFFAVFLGVVFGMAWFVSGVIGPFVSCSICGKFDTKDFYMIPSCGLLGPIFLVMFLNSYKKAK